MAGYSKKPNTCGGCRHFACDKVLPDWMVASNERMQKHEPAYVAELHGVEKKLRCSLHKFAVQKSGSCKSFEKPMGAP